MSTTDAGGARMFLVKYALSEGIEEVTINHEHCSTSDEFVYLVGRSFWSFKVGRDIFADRADAEKAADALRLKKVESLKKQIKRLEAMRFGVQP
jgi:hypothetical protein